MLLNVNLFLPHSYQVGYQEEDEAHEQNQEINVEILEDHLFQVDVEEFRGIRSRRYILAEGDHIVIPTCIFQVIQE